MKQASILVQEILKDKDSNPTYQIDWNNANAREDIQDAESIQNKYKQCIQMKTVQ